MSFVMDFATEFSSFRVDPEFDKYSSNASDPIIPIRPDEASGLEVENEDEEDIEKPGPRPLLLDGGLQHSPSIFGKHNSRLWDYIIDAQNSYHFALANYKKVCQAIQENLDINQSHGK